MTKFPVRPAYDPDVLAAWELARASFPPDGTDWLTAFRAASATSDTVDDQLACMDVTWSDEAVPGHRGGEISAKVFRRPGRHAPGPGILFIHGGGMIAGDNAFGAAMLGSLVEKHGAVAVSVGYRLAPEFPDPYPVEDCYAALTWVVEHACELGIDASRIVMIGGSAGGGLAAGTALLARDRGGPRVAGAMLFSPMLDDRDATVSTRQFDGSGGWDRAANARGWRALLGDRHGGPSVTPYAAPARASDMAGLPRMFIDCGSAEVFRDEVVAFASAIWESGGDAELHLWQGGFHGYEMERGAEISLATVAARESWLRRTLRVA